MISIIWEDYLQENELAFEDISYIDLWELEYHIENCEADKMYAFEYLSETVNDFCGAGPNKSLPCRDLCGSQNQIVTDKALLHQYVNCNNGRNLNDPLREEYRSYLAVKRIDLYTHFNWTDARIAFSIDVPDAGYS